MNSFPNIFTFPDPLVTISNLSMNSIASMPILGDTWASAAYPAANMALLIPFRISRPYIVSTLWCFNGATASGNLDLGIYSEDGTKIISTGSKAQSGTSTIQSFSVTSTELGAGLFYLAIALDNTTGTFTKQLFTNAQTLQLIGLAQVTSGFTLPATITFESFAQTYVPLIGCTGRSVL